MHPCCLCSGAGVGAANQELHHGKVCRNLAFQLLEEVIFIHIGDLQPCRSTMLVPEVTVPVSYRHTADFCVYWYGLS